MQEQQIQWVAYEHTQKKHNADWFWSIGAITVAGAVASIMLGNTLLGILILVGTTALFLQSIRKPKKIKFTVSEQGIHIGDALYPYKYLESFGTSEENILIKSKKKLMPFLVLPLPPEEKDEDVYNILTTFLPEEEHTESAAEKIMEQLGF